MDPHLEIRKLLPSQVKELVIILETHELWKCLMSIIPKNLEHDFVCDISIHNPSKYHSEHFRLIENASDKWKKPCTEILFDEWGTSGRIRPTLGHLLHLLIRSKLFRAADYVAVNLLHQPRPERPEMGPEAMISVDLPISPSDNQDLNEIEELLNRIDYPRQAVNIIRTNSIEKHIKTLQPPIPHIVITPEEEPPSPGFTIPVVVPRGTISESQTVSDMMMFTTDPPESYNTESESYSSSSINSSDESSNVVPILNKLIDFPNKKELASIENHDKVIKYSDTSNDLSSTLDTNEMLPFDELMASKDKTEPNIPNVSSSNMNQEQSQCHSDLIPNLEEMMKSNNGVTSNISESLSHPDFNMLMSSIGNKSKSKVSFSTLSTESKSRCCTSPLPYLSLNTMLPHYSYTELENCTNNFNSDNYTTDDQNGRFLGSGAFGSVYLALGLLNMPVAVKKLTLENVEVVNIDDTVTKQFRNEVEVLSKYKHDNLLSLLGYSCDGYTYCLLYEYVPGGALKDRLQDKENKLDWQTRMDIAVGTAKAVSYLHTAFSTQLIHRDIKSANILLDGQNNPKLSDFGLIKLSPTQQTSTATTVFGTSAYMAPEAFRRDISVKLDTFSFGVVLLELLTSLPPMDENRDGADLITHVQENCDDDDITPLLDKSAGSWEHNDLNYAQELYKIAWKCLEEKKKRPNMVEVTEKLELLVENIKKRS